jgi:hypothetical protein
VVGDSGRAARGAARSGRPLDRHARPTDRPSPAATGGSRRRGSEGRPDEGRTPPRRGSRETGLSALEGPQSERGSAIDTIAGLLAAASLVLSGIAMGLGLLLQLDARPARVAPVAILLALVAARMSVRYQSLALKAALFGAFAWVVGMTVAVVTDGPLL